MAATGGSTATTLGSAVAAAARQLAAAGVASPRFDADELAAHSLGVDRRDLWRHDRVGDDFDRLVERRARREPLQHITGVAHFRNVSLAVGPGVFVPRPETELVAGAAIDAARDLPGPLLVDLCTGSGAIALSLADELPGARVHAVELEAGAFAWAARNLVGSGVDLRLGDVADALPDLDGEVDVVVSNPPYIPAGSVPRDLEVRVHDPRAALYGGDDGLDVVRVVERTARRLLRPGGLVVVEHADVQGGTVLGVFGPAHWEEVADHDDLTGRPRYATARRRDAGPEPTDAALPSEGER